MNSFNIFHCLYFLENDLCCKQLISFHKIVCIYIYIYIRVCVSIYIFWWKNSIVQELILFHCLRLVYHYYYYYYYLDNLIVAIMERAIWTMNTFIENTRRCQLRYNVFDTFSVSLSLYLFLCYKIETSEAHLTAVLWFWHLFH